jgi:DNA/RNA-binding domain of Phe-tRNA-synthetase-like protein
MYKRVGLDPTKTRPSSEALLAGSCARAIHCRASTPSWTWCNWCSLEFQLPYGLYDAAHVEGDIELRLGHDGESYPGIRKDDVERGRPAHAGRRARSVRQPHVRFRAHDGDDRTTSAIVVVFAPAEMDSRGWSGARQTVARMASSPAAARRRAGMARLGARP